MSRYLALHSSFSVQGSHFSKIKELLYINQIQTAVCTQLRTLYSTVEVTNLLFQWKLFTLWSCDPSISDRIMAFFASANQIHSTCFTIQVMMFTRSGMNAQIVEMARTITERNELLFYCVGMCLIPTFPLGKLRIRSNSICPNICIVCTSTRNQGEWRNLRIVNQSQHPPKLIKLVVRFVLNNQAGAGLHSVLYFKRRKIQRLMRIRFYPSLQTAFVCGLHILHYQKGLGSSTHGERKMTFTLKILINSIN